MPRSTLLTEHFNAMVLDSVEQGLWAAVGTARIVRKTLSGAPDLTNTQRTALARRVFGVSCLRARLAHLASSNEPSHLLAAYLYFVEAETVETACRIATITPQGVRFSSPPRWPREALAALMAQCSLPQWLAEHFLTELGAEETRKLFDVVNQPGPVTVRCNLLKTNRETLQTRLEAEGDIVTQTPFSPWGLVLHPTKGRQTNIWGSEAWRDGWFEVQDEGSQLITLAASPRRGMRVVDLCAGRGGKTLGLAAVMEDQGRLIASDISGKALADMKPRLRRAGVQCVRSERVGQDETGLEQVGDAGADLVLVDAPCSQLGTLRRGPDKRWTLQPQLLQEMPVIQRTLLAQAAARVRPGGWVIYATCTLARAENEEMAAFAQQKLHLIPDPLVNVFGAKLCQALGIQGLGEQGHCMTLTPHQHNTDGFFIARFRAPGPKLGCALSPRY